MNEKSYYALICFLICGVISRMDSHDEYTIIWYSDWDIWRGMQSNGKEWTTDITNTNWVSNVFILNNEFYLWLSHIIFKVPCSCLTLTEWNNLHLHKGYCSYAVIFPSWSKVPVKAIIGFFFRLCLQVKSLFQEYVFHYLHAHLFNFTDTF